MNKQQSDIIMRNLPPISIYGYVGGRQIQALRAFVRVRVGVAIFFKVNR